MKYAQHTTEKDGDYTEWIYPNKKGYRVACCDCGLVHVFQFMNYKDGRGNHILIRAKRHVRATATKRASMKKKGEIKILTSYGKKKFKV